MNRLLVCSISLLTFGSACSKGSIGELFDGNWSGTATGADGVPVPMIAAFTYDPEASPTFSGSIDQGGYLFTIVGIVTDKELATITGVFPLGRSLTLSNTSVEEETTMAGDYSVDACYGQTPPNPDPACKLPGTFTMEAQ